MRRFLPKSLNEWLLTAIPLSILFAWLTGYWTLGAAAALGALCALAVRNPQQEFLAKWPWLTRWLPKGVSGTKSEESKPLAPLPPPPPRKHARKDKNMSLSEQMIAQGRVALLLRPQI